jgi:ABC-type transport system substrate-binding protein
VNAVQYNGMYISIGSADGHPATALSSSPSWSPVKNNSSFKTDEWTKLVEAAGTETDAAKLKALYAQVNDYITDQAWSIVFSERAVIYLTSAKIKGMVPTGRQSFLWKDVWLDA